MQICDKLRTAKCRFLLGEHTLAQLSKITKKPQLGFLIPRSQVRVLSSALYEYGEHQPGMKADPEIDDLYSRLFVSILIRGFSPDTLIRIRIEQMNELARHR